MKPVPFGVKFMFGGKSKMPRYFKFLIESGIWGKLEIMRVQGVNRDRKPAISMVTDEITIMGMRSGIATIFVLCGVIILGGIVVAGLEFSLLKIEIFCIIFQKHLRGGKVVDMT
ncbi:hypothetical protein Fcan01_24988 [Folsomia candida]|uniref:Uncharacterized protein n=1 Tax=Folsomia candida TaxID=158441 RepID=A0A226D437_FOLCA|nr:hypothetical protein Fcan01_24988 [Folsomia candida]